MSELLSLLCEEKTETPIPIEFESYGFKSGATRGKGREATKNLSPPGISKKILVFRGFIRILMKDDQFAFLSFFLKDFNSN